MIGVTFVVLFGLSAGFDPVTTAPKHITVQEGTNLKVTVPVTGDRFAFDLMGQIWVADTADGISRPVTDKSTVHARPVFSPDGEMIACETLHNGLQHIALMNADGSDHRRVTFGDFDHRTPAWSPDSKRLLFSSNRGGDYSIWELDIESLALAQTTFAPEDEWDPTWNSDGTQIAYVGGNANRSTLFSVRPGQPPAAMLHENNALYAPAWRPDDAVLTYVRASASGGALRMLILSNPAITKAMTSGENVFPHPVQWTGSRTILYAADGHIKQREFGSHYFRDVPFTATITINTPTNTRAPRAVAAVPGENLPVRGITGFSEHPDGRMVVSALGDLWELDTDGTLSRQLTNDAFVDSYPDISDDGQRIVFISDRGGEPQVWIMELGSRDTKQMTTAGFDLSENTVPVWDGDNVQAEAPVEQAPPPPIQLSWLPTQNSGRMIVRAGRIFDGISPDYVLRRELVIEDGLIAEIRPWSDNDLPRDDDVTYVDASEHTVMPGLIDVGARQAAANRESDGRAWLEAGVTSVRQFVHDAARAVEQRESWRSGRRAGPRLHFGLRACDEAIRDVLADPSTPIPSHLATLAVVEICAGNDSKQIQRTVAAAHDRGLAVSAPEPYPGILLGIDEMSLVGRPHFGPGGARRELSSAVYNDIIDLVAELQLSIVSNLSQHSPGGRRRQVEQQLFRIVGRDGRVATGSGAPVSAPRGFGLHEELQRLVASGLQPFQVLKMATLEAARVLGRDTELGSLQPGKLADVVVVDGDPLADIGQTANVVIVIVDGQVFSRKALREPGLRGWTVGKLYN